MHHRSWRHPIHLMLHLQGALQTTPLKLMVNYHLCSVILSSNRTINDQLNHCAGEYLSRTLGNTLIHDGFMNETQQTNDQQADEQTQESRAHRRSRERTEQVLLEQAEIQDSIAHRRSNRQNIPHGERHAQQQRSNARFSAKQTTQRAESITMSCPGASTSTPPDPSSSTQASPPESASASTPAYTVGTDGNLAVSWSSSYICTRNISYIIYYLPTKKL
jgi:DNA mismatch repair ATPase MutL